MNLTGLSPNNPTSYTGAKVALNTVVTRNRQPTGADYRQPETGKLYPFNTFWLVSKDPTTGVQGELWYLSKIEANVGYWVKLSDGSVSSDSFEVMEETAPGVNPVTPDDDGLTTINASIVANHSVPIETHTRALHEYNVEVQYATTAASTDGTKSGFAHFKSTEFSADASGFVSLLPNSGIQASNIGIAYSAGTFTVQGYDGTALSATNPGIVWLQDKTNPGRLKKYLVTANQTFTDGAAGTTATQRWNLTAGVNWATDMPFYLYAVGNDAETTIAFMISRIPHATVSPAAASIGKTGAIVNVGQGDFFSLANITVADYDANPCLLLGSFRMQFVGATNSWTVQTLTTTDGIGNYQEGKVFSVAKGQLGAAAGKFFANNGGTAPDASAGISVYTIDRNGLVVIDIGGNIDTAGVGAGACTLISPFRRTSGLVHASGFWVSAGGSPGSTIVTTFAGSSDTFILIANTLTAVIDAVELTNASMGITATFRIHGSFTAAK